jgi:hypothetical protein
LTRESLHERFPANNWSYTNACIKTHVDCRQNLKRVHETTRVDGLSETRAKVATITNSQLPTTLVTTLLRPEFLSIERHKRTGCQTWAKHSNLRSELNLYIFR